ncbi:AAA family ATPase [Rapidithrix thailandica]|uniref:AAA family ATPase n=1 Tax=Rapidithrix thailandica TaxID=413964 RepID=A0AAW9S4M8_9BACT
MQEPSILLTHNFIHTPTEGQKALFERLGAFILEKKKARSTFLLKGYAGTGKTSVLASLIRTLRAYDYKSLLLAPTGRAAKVMASYTNRRAFTIHKIIFKQEEDPYSGRLIFKRVSNTYKDTFFIVDEASMINDLNEMGGKGLLSELISYVFQKPNSGNKLLLIGDTAQLPPVHQELSPALDAHVLQDEFHLQVTSCELDEVVRQEVASGILENATRVRNQIAQQEFAMHLDTQHFKDIYRMTGDRLEDGLRYAYDKFGIENTVVVCRTNRAATQYNQFIRRQINFSEDELEAGDLLMIVKNDYHWLPENSPAGFLANGEFVEVLKVRNYEEMHGFRFADLTLRLVDYPDHDTVDVKIHLETLHSFTPNLDREQLNKLYELVQQDYMDIEDRTKRNSMIRKDPYLNALQVKFAYALTCHKSQGGQWNSVFVDLGYLTEERKNVELMRWLYTAITRASDELYLVNFSPDFFE